MSTDTVARKFELVDRDLTAVDLAALTVASRPLAKVRGDLVPGEHMVWMKLLITGGVTVGEPVPTRTPADTLGVLAYVLARLPRQHREAVAAAIANGAIESVSKADRAMAKALCEPTCGQSVRSGAISGTLQVDVIR